MGVPTRILPERPRTESITRVAPSVFAQWKGSGLIILTISESYANMPLAQASSYQPSDGSFKSLKTNILISNSYSLKILRT